MKRTADSLFKAIMMDVFPSLAVCVDYGITSQQVYEAYCCLIKKGNVSADDLHKIVGDGKKLTEVLKNCEDNPHKEIIIKTIYDET
jgi:hypothetical protein